MVVVLAVNLSNVTAQLTDPGNYNNSCLVLYGNRTTR